MEKGCTWVIKREDNDIVITIPGFFKYQGRWLRKWGEILTTWFDIFSVEICKQLPYYYVRLNTFGKEKYIQELCEKALNICQNVQVNSGEPNKLDFFSCSFSADFLHSVFSNADVEVPGAVFLISEQPLSFEQVVYWFAKIETNFDNCIDLALCDKSISGLFYTIDNQVIIPAHLTSLSSLKTSLVKAAEQFNLSIDWQV